MTLTLEVGGLHEKKTLKQLNFARGSNVRIFAQSSQENLIQEDSTCREKAENSLRLMKS